MLKRQLSIQKCSSVPLVRGHWLIHLTGLLCTLSCATTVPCVAEFVTTQGCLVSYSSQATSRPKADSAVCMLSSSLQCQVPTTLYIKGLYLSFLFHYIFFFNSKTVTDGRDLQSRPDTFLFYRRGDWLESVGAQLGESEAGCLWENVLSLCVFCYCCGQIPGYNHLQERWVSIHCGKEDKMELSWHGRQI